MQLKKRISKILVLMHFYMYEKGISIPFPLFSIQMGFPAVFFSSAASLIGKAINENKMENLFINESETIRLCVCAKRCPTTCL